MKSAFALAPGEARVAAGKAARLRAPLESHGEFSRSASRDPIGLLLGQAGSRVPDLVPVRHGRMLVSPFTYYRGAALPMAADLAGTPSSGLRAQLCGDAHLSNFGVFGSPERRVVFDLNDFDETLPGPFEWDVKRLVASFAIAGRENGFPAKVRRTVTRATGAAYRTAMREFACMPILDVWYSRFDVEAVLAELRSEMPRKAVRQTEAHLAKARARDSTQAVAKLAKVVDGQRRIVSDPPLIVPIEELAGDIDVDEIYRFIAALALEYTQTLPADRRRLAERFKLSRLARKVVGVGSVGTETWVLLMEPDDGLAPLLLQAKEAQRSVLADYAGESEYDNQGERVVVGQRLMQAVGDILLGWVRARPPIGGSKDFYLRQLRDWKYAVEVTSMTPEAMTTYGRMCGWTLARAHARTGERIAIASYLGKSDAFEQAVSRFAERYADQTEADHAALAQAVASGRAQALVGV
ncbi:MAG: DUF2252 domain-containing protein [Acidimicrobiales bacterium]